MSARPRRPGQAAGHPLPSRSWSARLRRAGQAAGRRLLSRSRGTRLRRAGRAAGRGHLFRRWSAHLGRAGCRPSLGGSAPAVIVALYPPAVRERWGDEIGREVAERGVRSWPDAVVGALRLWLHPSDWPETTIGQTQRVLAAALFAVTGAVALLMRASGPAAGWWTAPILAGVLLATPRPSLRRSDLRRMSTVTVRTLVVPAVAVGAMLVLGNSGLVEHPQGPFRVLLLAYYWATLAYAALRLCALAARLLSLGAVPSRRRVRGALLLAGSGAALAAGQSGTLLATAALALLAAVTLHAGQDLRAPAR